MQNLYRSLEILRDLGSPMKHTHRREEERGGKWYRQVPRISMEDGNDQGYRL
jgi:hypothetical protein